MNIVIRLQSNTSFDQNRESVIKKNPWLCLRYVMTNNARFTFMAISRQGCNGLNPCKNASQDGETRHHVANNTIRNCKNKWNVQKPSANTLHIASIQNKPNTPVHNITNNNMNQAILPIQMRPKPAKHAPKITRPSKKRDGKRQGKIANPNAKHAGKERSQSTMNFGSQSTMERKDRKAQCCDT
eukprot:287649_1